MSLAHKMDTYNRTMEGSTARALHREERAPRPETRPTVKPKKAPRHLVVMGIAGWACVMAFSMALVHRNTQALEEAGAITRARANLAAIEQQNRDLATKLETQVSVAKVQEWAEAHSMKRPTVVNKLNGDPTAVAVRPEPAQARVKAAEAAPAPGLWSALKGYFAGLGSATKSAAGKQ